jgi:hypothetical protein
MEKEESGYDKVQRCLVELRRLWGIAANCSSVPPVGTWMPEAKDGARP